MRLLLDCNVHRLPAASELIESHDELIMWGDFLIASRHFKLGPIGKFKRPFADEFAFVPSLARSAPALNISFVEYWLIDHERYSVPASIDWLRRDIDAMFTKSWIDVAPQPTIIRGPSFDDRQQVRDFIKSTGDRRLNQLIAAFGEAKSSQDAFHFWVCVRYELAGILTLDAKLKRKVDQLSQKLGLRARAWLPSEICSIRNITAVDASWFDASTSIWTGQIVTLFQRQATFSDRMIFKIYGALKYVARSTGLPFQFKIPGYLVKRKKRNDRKS